MKKTYLPEGPTDNLLHRIERLAILPRMQHPEPADPQGPLPASPSNDESELTTSDSADAEARIDRELEREKLRLEIAELRRSSWSKPSVAVPVIATLATLALSQYLGVFAVEQKKAEINAREAKFEKEKAEQGVAQLRRETEVLTKEENDLRELKTGLGSQVATLQTDVSRLTREAAAQSALAASAQQETSRARATLRHTRTVLARPRITILHEVIPNEKSARIYLVNRGPGAAEVRQIRPYVDGQLMPAGPATESFGPTLDALAMNDTWIRWSWHTKTLPADETQLLLMIEPEQFTPEHAEQFKAAIERLGFEVCYCSALGDCFWSTFRRPEAPLEQCSYQ